MGNICKKLFFKNKPGPKVRTVVPNLTQPEHLPYRNKNHPNREYPSNRVKTTKYTILTFLPKNLFEQFHRYANIYFMMVVLLNWIPDVSAFGKEISMIPLLFVLSVTAFKDAYEDFRRYQSDKRVNAASCRWFSRKDGRYVRSSWCDLRVGDFVHLSCNEIIPADILLLKSSDSSDLCHIETSNIDGETNLKQRFAVSGIPYNTADGFSPVEFTHSIECELPSTDIYKFHGNVITSGNRKVAITQNNLLLRGCLIRNTDFVEGLVIYAGPETKAMLNNRGPRYKRSKLERRMNRDLAWCVVLLLFLCFFCAIGSGIWVAKFKDISVVPFIPQQKFDDFSPLYQGFIVFWTYIIIFQAVIPLPLYVSLEIIKLVQVYFIQNDKELYYEPTDKRVECRALNITEDLGQVEYIFSDKTGTLTENQMEFKSCTIGGIDYPHGCDFDECESEMRSRHSMSNLSSSSEFWDMKLEPSLQRDVQSMCCRSLDSVDISIPPQTRRVQDFFLLMTICNTVVVSPHAHEDKMDASGLVLQDTDQHWSTGKLSYDKLSRAEDGYPGGKHKGLENGGFVVDDDLSSRTRTPSEGSITDTSTSILSESSIEGRYDAESPDELALVKAASSYGCRLLKRMSHSIVVLLPAEGVVEYDLLHVLPFDSVRKRMSVIVRCPFSKEILLYTKGADSAILSQLHPAFKEKEEEKRIMELTQEHLDSYAKKGLRTLCMGKRVLDPQEYELWKLKHVAAENSMEDREKKLFESACEIETDLDLLGATGIEDKLQEGVPETIANLRKAGIRIWVLTGDKQETAIQIAYASKLISPGEELIIINARDQESTCDLIQHHLEQLAKDAEETNSDRSSWIASKKKSPTKKQPPKSAALIIDGRTLSFALESETEVDKAFLELAMRCSSVVCCRSTPIQKAAVVKLVRDELKQLTLAIGDGANDVSMIQTADVGVGISGQEGMQAVMASDFALARFKFLERLLLVHGHWCYDRLARFALYMFYKNPLPNFTIFWFQIYSGFSGSITMDQYYLLLLHVLFTAFPPAVNGIFDKDVSAKTLLHKIELYKVTQKGTSYTTLLFWITILETWLQSIALHFIPHLAYAGSNVGLWEVGTTMTVSLILTMLLYLGIETWCWTWIHWVILVTSFLLYWIFAIVLGSFCTTCDSPSNPYWVMQSTVTTPIHWLVVCLTCLVCLLPRFTYRCLQTTLFPNDVLKARLDEKRGLSNKSTRRKSSRRQRPKAKKSLDMSTSSPSSLQKPQLVNGARPATSSSVEVQVEAFQNRAMSKNSNGTKLHTIESKEL